MSTDTERLVLSEVHVGNSALDEEEVVSRYAYLTPLRRSTSTSSPAAAQDARAGNSADNSDSDSDSNDSSSGGESEEGGGYSRVARHRKRLRTSSQRRRPAHEVLTVVHRMATTLSLVGQQVWSAAFLLGDFVLTHQDLFADMQVLELGAGPGVAGLVAARVARRCYLTDYHREVLKLLARNAEANRHLFAVGRWPTHTNATADSADSSSRVGEGDFSAEGDTPCGGGGGGGCVVAVRELDWFTFSREEGSTVASIRDPPEEGQDGLSEEDQDRVGAGSRERYRSNDNGTCPPFSWRKEELEGLSLSTSPGGGLVLVAADVIYDEALTDAFFRVLRLLMPVPVPPVPAGGNSGDELADGGSDEVASVQKDTKLGKLVDHTPFAQSASGDSVAIEAAAGGTKSAASDGHVCPGAEEKEQAVLYLALEKRFNFSVAELSVAATGYSALLRNVLDTTEAESGGAGEDRSAQRGNSAAKKDFEGRRLLLSFRQCFRYQRSDAMEIWEIRRRGGR